MNTSRHDPLLRIEYPTITNKHGTVEDPLEIGSPFDRMRWRAPWPGGRHLRMEDPERARELVAAGCTGRWRRTLKVGERITGYMEGECVREWVTFRAMPAQISVNDEIQPWGYVKLVASLLPPDMMQITLSVYDRIPGIKPMSDYVRCEIGFGSVPAAMAFCVAHSANPDPTISALRENPTIASLVEAWKAERTRDAFERLMVAVRLAA